MPFYFDAAFRASPPKHVRAGAGDQTAAHLFAECADEKSRAMRGLGTFTKEEVWNGLSDYKKSPAMARALVSGGRLPQFRAFNKLRQLDNTAAEGESVTRPQEVG